MADLCFQKIMANLRFTYKVSFKVLFDHLQTIPPATNDCKIMNLQATRDWWWTILNHLKTQKLRGDFLMNRVGYSSSLLSRIILWGFILSAWSTFIPGPCLAGSAPEELTTAITRVAKQNIPAVVHVEVTERHEIANPLIPFEGSPLFKYFFGKNMPKKFQQEIVGLGSGMIIDPEGHILTNSHVVSGATKIQVVLSDGRWFDEKSLKVIGTDPKTDLAVIQITAKGPFPQVVLGDSDKMEIGQWVVAIGQPRGCSRA